ncbi:hypothetical protein JCM13664_20660 [Methylothermus subterraneus]
MRLLERENAVLSQTLAGSQQAILGPAGGEKRTPIYPDPAEERLRMPREGVKRRFRIDAHEGPVFDGELD